MSHEAEWSADQEREYERCARTRLAAFSRAVGVLNAASEDTMVSFKAAQSVRDIGTRYGIFRKMQGSGSSQKPQNLSRPAL